MNHKFTRQTPPGGILDATGKPLNVGDMVAYAVGTRSSGLSFGVITKIKETREETDYDADTRWNREAFTEERIKVSVGIEHREADGSLIKQLEYPNGYHEEPEWMGNYTRTKTNLTDTTWHRQGKGIHQVSVLGQPMKISRYLRLDNVKAEQ